VTRVDPITGAVIQGALENIAIEMGHKLMRMSYSSIIRESEDFGAALTDAEGRQLCECKMSTPLQSGPIPGYVRGIRRRLAARGDVFRPGDVIMHNDPYGGASHGPDVAFCVPVAQEQTADQEVEVLKQVCADSGQYHQHGQQEVPPRVQHCCMRDCAPRATL
jgi:N-methylhydantoinase B/oxoprolinase/acetone carboxylase alpha subunit